MSPKASPASPASRSTSEEIALPEQKSTTAAWRTPKNFQYACATGAMLTSIFNAAGLAAAGFLPPIPPSWDAQRTAQHYINHEQGMRVGAALIVFSGMFYLPFVVLCSAQMRRIPGLPPALADLQLAGGTAGSLVFILSGIVLACAHYRLDRPVEITQALNDLFWIMYSMPWPPFMVQNLAYSYAILWDVTPKPLFPRYIVALNVIAPLLYVPAAALSSVKTGPLAWNGAVTFWIPAVGWCIQVIISSFCLAKAISAEAQKIG